MTDDVDAEQAELIHELVVHSDRTLDRIERLHAAEVGTGSDNPPEVAHELKTIVEAQAAIGEEVRTTDITIDDIADDGTKP